MDENTATESKILSETQNDNIEEFEFMNVIEASVALNICYEDLGAAITVLDDIIYKGNNEQEWNKEISDSLTVIRNCIAFIREQAWKPFDEADKRQIESWKND